MSKDKSAMQSPTQNVASPSSQVAGDNLKERATTALHVVIDNVVLAQVARLAASEVEGVFALEPIDAVQGATALLQRVAGSESKVLGVRVAQGESECAVDLSMTVEYGASIPKLDAQVRGRVSERVKTLTGYEIVELNITVIGIHFSDEPVKPAKEEHRVLR